MILVQWPFACEPSLIPWWVGPSRLKKPWGVYWEPLLEAIQKKVNDSVDAASWLAGTGVDSVLVAIVTPFFSEYEGKVYVLDGAAMVEVVVPDEIINSRDLAEVAGYIEPKAFEALGEVAKTLKIDSPVQLSGSDRAAGEQVTEPDRISRIGEERLDNGVLILVPARMVEREYAHAIAQVAEEVGEDRLHGWRVFRDGASEPALEGSVDLSVEADFRAMNFPIRLADLEGNKANALVVIGRNTERIGSWFKKLDSLAQGVALNPVLTGRDGEFEWVVFGFADRRNRGN